MGWSSLCNSEASRMAFSIASAISTALEYFSLASDSNRFWCAFFAACLIWGEGGRGGGFSWCG